MTRTRPENMFSERTGAACMNVIEDAVWAGWNEVNISRSRERMLQGFPDEFYYDVQSSFF